MPIGDRPLMEFWLQTLHQAGIRKVLVNLHNHVKKVEEFLQMPQFRGWVDSTYEENLLGTAGTLFANKSYFKDCTILLVHADNWCQCYFPDFLDFHQFRRPDHCPLTMMTFESSSPQTCGIVETDHEGIVLTLHEKVANPPGHKANGAVYLLEPEVLEWLEQNRYVSDFSNEVIPPFLGRIATWHNTNIHRDIGHISMLQLAQSDPRPNALWDLNDEWHEKFMKIPIHNQILKALN